ncbi:MAG TPA: glycosyltransferase [Stellaceae bacterium]|nr:glycosyltransferase [Stellaceae bacterium]
MKISVVIPCHNAASHLERAVASVVAQGIAETEIIIVDDASSDATAEVARELRQRVANLTLIRLAANLGPGAARNAGLERACGACVAFLDADDAYSAGVFALALDRLEALPWADAFAFGVHLVDAHRQVHPLQLALIANSIPGNVVVRRAFAASIGGFPADPALRGARAGEDVAFRLALRRWGAIVTSDAVHLDYAVRRGSHFDRFLDTTHVVGDRIAVALPDEEARRARVATNAHLARADAAMLAAIGDPKLCTVPCEIAGRRFDFETFDRPDAVAEARAALAGTALPPLAPVRTILDVGAGTGADAVRLAATYQAARVIALEPAREAHVLLRRNAAAHPNLEPYRVGLGSGEAPFVDPDPFLAALGVGALDLVRLDARGFAPSAAAEMADRLRGAGAVLVRYPPGADIGLWVRRGLALAAGERDIGPA